MEGAKRPPATDEAATGGGLEASLLQIIHHHQIQTARLREQTDKSKKDAVRTAAHVSDLLVNSVNGGVQETYINEKLVEHEVRGLLSTAMRYKKQTDQWLATTHALNSVLKEIGDFENWMKIMDFDCKTINAAIRNIYQS